MNKQNINILIRKHILVPKGVVMVEPPLYETFKGHLQNKLGLCPYFLLYYVPYKEDLNLKVCFVLYNIFSACSPALEIQVLSRLGRL